MIKEAYFISNKTYCLVLEDGTVTVKSKGVVSDEMDLEDFKTLYYQAESIRTIKRQTVRDYTKGSVSIDTVDVYVSSESFTKREKIYNSEGLWVDTKPLVYNNTTKDIVLINKNDNK